MKLHNYRCSINLTQFDLYYETFETAPNMTRINFFFQSLNDDATLSYVVIVALRSTI